MYDIPPNHQPPQERAFFHLRLVVRRAYIPYPAIPYLSMYVCMNAVYVFIYMK